MGNEQNTGRPEPSVKELRLKLADALIELHTHVAPEHTATLGLLTLQLANIADAFEVLHPTPAEQGALEAAAALLAGESFDAEAAAVRGYLQRLAKASEPSKGADGHA
jgi:hypothetical protein